MKKTGSRIIGGILLICLLAACFAGCTGDPAGPTQPASQDVDYAASVKLDMNSNTAKQKVTVHTYVDGDTTHFNVPTSINHTGILKARYLGINTPESTGSIEPYGKKASNFTKEKLSSATSIYLECDGSEWVFDSTGGRNLVWIWYRTSETEEYRNLNIEILQNGLAIGSAATSNRYGQTCLAAIMQAQANKLNVHSGQRDPDFFYDGAIPVDLKGLRTNVEAFNNKKVMFNGIITKESNNSVYIEQFDAETNRYYGISVFYGYGMSGLALDILSVGNEVKIVGTVQFYETGGYYQVSGLSYQAMRPDPDNIELISKGHQAAYQLTDPKEFVEGKVTLEVNEEVKTFDYAALALGTSVEMKNLQVKSIYTTQKEDSSSNGAMTLTCEVDGVTIIVRTVVLYGQGGELVTAEMYEGKNIDVKGIVDYFGDEYQIKVFTDTDIKINE